MSLYPSAPWILNATAYVSFWRIPATDFPIALGDGIERLTMLGSSFLCSGFIQYEPGSDLQYRELFLAVLARAGRRLGTHLPLIWVDSAASLEGGRELWAIPKQSAAFHLEHRMLRAEVDGKLIASLSFEPGARLLRRLPIRSVVMQLRNSELVRTPFHVSAEIETMRAQWYIPENSPLSPLRERSPLISFKLNHARVRFGA